MSANQKHIPFPLGQMTGGEWIQISPISAAKAAQYFGNYIGCLPNLSLLIALPESGNQPLLQKDQLLNIRMAKQGGVYTFQSTVLSLANQPARYFHLAYPKSVEYKNFRRWPRVSVLLPVEVLGESEFSDGSGMAQARLINISMGGALLESEVQFGGVGDIFRMSAEFSAGGISRGMEIQCVIRSIRVREDTSSRQAFAQHGVQFLGMDAMEDTDKIFLYGYVCEQFLYARINSVL